MRFFLNKKILILSPQSWGRMQISKHHYALEFARLGNEVLFMNPPELSRTVNGLREVEGIQILSHSRPYYYDLKFHFPWLYYQLMSRRIKDILSKTGFVPDVVFSFDLGGDYSLSFFENTLKIFFPVDEPRSKLALRSGIQSDLIFSVTNEILAAYNHLPAKKIFLNHGLSSDFAHQIASNVQLSNSEIKVGYSGNLLRSDIDKTTIETIIRENRSITFEFWGNMNSKENELGFGEEIDSGVDFIQFLSYSPNVILHGPVSSSVLAEGLRRMDLFLICYDISKDQSSGTNYHKIMEYLSTGKIIVSNNVSTYMGSSLFRMCESRQNNNELPIIFKECVDDIEKWNAPELQAQRKQFADEHLYSRQVEKIDAHVHRFINL